MSTAEDVFWLYERNKNVYCNCNKLLKCNHNINDKCISNNECYCYLNEIVQPLTIGYQDISCRLNVKSYIKQGEECPICMDLILTKQNAYLTECGHAFHKICIFKSYENKYLSKYCSQFKCPLCRANIGAPEISERYLIDYFPTKSKSKNVYSNELDKLENFWLFNKFHIYNLCSNNYDHPCGFKKDCNSCTQYRTINLPF